MFDSKSKSKSKCIKQNTKKYKSRSSPPYSAMDCQGKTITGNDGTMYTSTSDKRGVYRWVKSGTLKNKTIKKISGTETGTGCFKDLKRTSAPFYKYAYKKSIFAPVNVSNFLKCIKHGIVSAKDTKVKPKYIYEIIDNGGIPFLVFDYGGRVGIYNQVYTPESNQYEIKGKIMDSKYSKIFIGDNDLNAPDYDLKKGSGRGNTILLQTGKNKYMYIGDGIRSFTTKDGDVIQKYYSPVGNNAVPYPYALGQKYVYLMLDDTCIPVEMFDLTKDVYTQYYGFNIDKKEHDLYIEKFKNKSKKYSVKILFKRFYK
jgi:hypothetical protein